MKKLYIVEVWTGSRWSIEYFGMSEAAAQVAVKMMRDKGTTAKMRMQ